MAPLWFISFVVLSFSLTIVVAVPVIIEYSEFNDPWEYKITPHRTPLLNSTVRKHELPPEPEVILLKTYSLEKPKPSLKSSLIRGAKKLANSVRSQVSCPACKIGVGLLQKEVRLKKSTEEIKTKFVSLCVGFKIETEGVCAGAFDVFSTDILAVLNTITMGPAEICRLVLGESCSEVDIPEHDWYITFPNTIKPKPKEQFVKSGLPTFKVLHLSDTHFDPEYVVGSPSNCDEPLCCRLSSTPPAKEEINPAGKWGSYSKCDSPKILIENMLKNIAKEHKDIDYIIWTGDLPPHDVWNQTKQENLDNLRYTVQEVFDNFPGIPIFPALGNHESIPAGSYAPPWVKDKDHSIDWLYNEVSLQWSKWLPAYSNNTLLHGGFYSVLIRPGFRLISLNMNYCHYISWWLLVNSTDPAKELQWLIYELQEAENNGEKVHIIGHIPPGSSDCMKVWSRNYYDVINRYESTVTAQFFGHTHADEFELFYETEEFQRPTSIAYIGPSVTTFENLNPGYRIYYVDGDHGNSTWEVIDHETWILDLEKANQQNEEDPEWFRLYSARQSFGLQSLKPEDWNDLLDTMVHDDELFSKFYRYYYKDSPTRPACDTSTCKLQILCDLKSGRSHDRHNLCRDLEVEFGS